MRLVWQKIRAMSNKYHRKETSNMYNAENINQVALQINVVRPPNLPFGSDGQGMCKPFTLMELETALKATKIRSAPGRDGIDYYILRALPKEYKECLLRIYNEVLQTGLFPVE